MHGQLDQSAAAMRNFVDEECQTNIHAGQICKARPIKIIQTNISFGTSSPHIGGAEKKYRMITE
jgi:hypothetical protein